MVKRFLFAAAVLLTVGVLGPATAVAGAPVVLSGGGTGTFDGIHPGSQFGMGVVFRGGSVQGRNRAGKKADGRARRSHVEEAVIPCSVLKNETPWELAPREFLLVAG